jgi:VanZ family protein
MKLSQGLRRALRMGWALALLAILIGSLLPNASAPMRLVGWLHLQDKLLHFGGYAMAALLPALHERRRALAVIVLALIAFGVFIEFAQTLTVDRSFELPDIVADAGGVLFGLILGLVIRGTAGASPRPVVTLITTGAAKPVPDVD